MRANACRILLAVLVGKFGLCVHSGRWSLSHVAMSQWDAGISPTDWLTHHFGVTVILFRGEGFVDVLK